MLTIHRLRLFVPLLVGLVLAACGGSKNSTNTNTDRSSAPGTTNASADAAPPALLTAQTLAAAERVAKSTTPARTPLETVGAGKLAAWSDYASGAVARKAAAVRLPVYRFYNTQTAAHFYTTSETEKTTVQSSLPQFSYDGPGFSAASGLSPGLSPVYRFYNTQTGVHFYTISETEKASILAGLPQYQLEGTAYHASMVAGAGFTPLYRFYVPSRGFHFYTASATEKDSVIANLSATYTYEGIGYYVLATDWVPETLPHTGVTDAQCLEAGNTLYVGCSSSGAQALNLHQDGQRTSVNAMSFGAVARTGGGTYALTECIKDNVTGLVWEGKTDDDGQRDKDNTYTNLGGGAATDTSGYVDTVNALGLCGYTDWRLPTRQELALLMDYGAMYDIRLNAAFLPNAAGGLGSHWTSDIDASSGSRAWVMDLGTVAGTSGTQLRSSGQAVRLVRGAPASGTRFTYSTMSYGSDAANNVVVDHWTGLHWRRCEQGQAWSGSACTGTASVFTHEEALSHARLQTGWRMPNAKELLSLTDLSRAAGPVIDATAFPGASINSIWSTTPYPWSPPLAAAVNFNAGNLVVMGRGSSLGVRLILRGS